MSASAPFIELERFSTFGDLLKYLRRRVGLTQRELSIAVGYSIAQISRLEQNQRLPDLAMIAARFVPALELDDAASIAKRLMELAATVRSEDAPASGAPPYKGLNYFDEGDADLYFGRTALVAKLLARLLGHPTETGAPRQNAPWPFLAIVGASGSGKSSVVRAGLVHALRWKSPSANWPIHTLTPTAHPLEALALSLTRESSSTTTTATLMDDLGRDPRALYLWARRLLNRESKATAAAPRLVLVVDQFEELFTLCQADGERAAFVDNLLTASFEPDGPVRLVITLRADFYAHCAPYAALRAALAKHQEYIGPMNADELRQAIEEPARRGGWELEEGLADMILRDIGADGSHSPEPGALPLLSHALLETWHRRRGRALTLSGYLASGGVRGAIAETAETVFRDQLDSQQQAIARHIFLRLTALGEDEDILWTRRRVGYDELIPTEAETTLAREVLTYLADARLITTSEAAAEVAHEALLREWPRLSEWLASNRASLRLQRQLTNAAADWRKAKCDASFLLTGVRLTQFENLALFSTVVLTQDERAYLEASLAERDRHDAEERERQGRELEAARKLAQTERARADSERQRAEEQVLYVARVRTRNRAIALAGAVATLLAVLAGLFGWQSSQNAMIAQSNFTHAEAQRLAAEAQTGSDPQLNVLLAIRSLNLQHTLEGENALGKVAERLVVLRQQFVGHIANVRSVAFSPDGQYVLTGSDDQTARLWDAQTGQELRRFGQSGVVLDVAFSPDSKSIIIGGSDGIAQLWDTQTGERVGPSLRPGGGVVGVAFSPDGKYFLTGAYRDVRLWDTQTRQEVRSFVGHTVLVPGVAFSPDGNFIATSGNDGLVRLWDVLTGQEVWSFTGHTDAVPGVAFSPDGKYILTGSHDGTARLLDARTGRELQRFTTNTGQIGFVAFSPDGVHILTGSEVDSASLTTQLWDVRTGQQLHVFTNFRNSALDVAFSPDGKYILASSPDANMGLWDISVEFPQFVGHTGGVNGIAFSPNGAYVLTGSNDQTARLWDARTGQEERVFPTGDVVNNGVAFSYDNKYMLTGSWDANVFLRDVQTGELLRAFYGHLGPVNGVAFSLNGKQVATASRDQTARLWDAQTGKQQLLFKGHSDEVYGVVFSPDGQYVLTGSWDNTARLWNAQTGVEVVRFIGHTDHVNGVAFSPDGKYVATASHDQTARVWDAQTGEELQRFSGHASLIWSVAFSPDGQYLLTGSDDATARLWDVRTGEETRRFLGHTGGVEWAVFSPDGKSIATASDDGTARLWSVDYPTTIDFLCSRLLRDFTDAERAQYGIPNDGPTCPTP